MNKNQVILLLRDWSGDQIDAPMCMKLIELFENDRPFGRIILRLLRFAENGMFKEKS